MDQPQYTSAAVDELRRIEAEVQDAERIAQLRYLYDRVQELRRTYVDDFDLQLAIGQVQQKIIDRGGVLLDGAKFTPPRREGAAKPDVQVAHPPEPPPPPVTDAPAPAPLPPDVERIDRGTWKRAVYIGTFFTLIICAGFFYLIQTARRLNWPSEEQPSASAPAAAVEKAADTSKPPAAAPPVPSNPTLRLYTDLIPGSVSIDNAEPRELQDGELQLDTLKPGHHTVRLTGRNGDAAFDFDIAEKKAPQLTAPPTGNNALVVTVSTQEGTGQLMASSADSAVLLDNNGAGNVSADGLALQNLGTADHDLQINRANDAQRFILTYTAAPALTVFVKSDPNAGSLVVVAGQDGADVIIDNVPYRRKTEHGQLRIPTLKVGTHSVKLQKAGFLDVPPQTVEIKKGEESRLAFQLQPLPQAATIQIAEAPAGTQILFDNNPVAAVTAGPTTVNNVKPGTHTIELRREGFQTKRLERTVKAGETITVGGTDVVLDKVAAAAPAQPEPVTPTQTAETPPGPASAPAQDATTSNAPVVPATLPGSVHKGGGFLIYHNPKSSGRYVFSMQLRRGGGFLKSKRLQWFAHYQDTENYTAFQVDGKNFIVRQVVNGKSREIKKVPFEADPEGYIQIDMGLKPNAVDVKLRPAEGSWQDMGPVTSMGQDFTQGKFGVIIGGNDEVGISTIRFGK